MIPSRPSHALAPLCTVSFTAWVEQDYHLADCQNLRGHFFSSEVVNKVIETLLSKITFLKNRIWTASDRNAGSYEIESFNGRLRDECLNVHQFMSIVDTQTKIEAWRVDYNQRRPHSSLGHLTPNEFVALRQVIQAVEEVVCSS